MNNANCQLSTVNYQLFCRKLMFKCETVYSLQFTVYSLQRVAHLKYLVKTSFPLSANIKILTLCALQ